MSVNPIDAKALKDCEYYWLHAPAVMGDDGDPYIIGQYAVSCNAKSANLWYVNGEFHTMGPGITPISHIKKPKWEPK